MYNSAAKKNIIVYGGTGYYGRKVVEKLINKGEQVKVLTRNKNKAQKILGDKVEIFEGDILSPGIIYNSLRNINAIVICLAANNSKQIRHLKKIEFDAVLQIMDNAAKAGIPRLVYMSGYELREDVLRRLNLLDFGEIKLGIEKAIRESSFNWTILGDSPSFEIFFAMTKNGRMTVPGGGFSPIPCISAEDVGEITAQTVLRDDLNGVRLKLTGPKAYNFPEAAELLSKLSGKRIKHLTIPLPLFNAVSLLMLPFNPFPRYLFKAVKMMNNFPQDLSDDVPDSHKHLREQFNYSPVTLEQETIKRIAEKKAPFDK